MWETEGDMKRLTILINNIGELSSTQRDDIKNSLTKSIKLAFNGDTENE